jgi:hypothetical protein
MFMKYEIDYLGKHYKSESGFEVISDKEFCDIVNEWYATPKKDDVIWEMVGLRHGNSSINLITKYYFRKLMDNTLHYRCKWTINEVMQNKELLSVFVDKVKKPIQIVSVLGDEQLVFGRIEELDGFTTIYLKAEHIEPIPLTPEILEKNGFVDYEVGKGWYVLNVAAALRVWLHRNSHDWTFQLMKWSPLSTHEIGKVFIKHTHQLQRALRLAGVEKEIEV